MLGRGRTPNASLLAAFTGLLCAGLQLGPVVGQGYVLLRDMVFVPREPLTASLLGTTGVPRAVPSDLLVALLSRIVPGDVVQDVILLGIVVLGAWGAGRLLAPSRPAAVAAAALYGWNPYLTEHLLLGQWAILLGYAALPWVAAAAADLRQGRPVAGRRLLLWLAFAAAGGASAELLAAIVALPMLAWPGGTAPARRVLLGIGALAVVALPWAVPALTQPTPAVADRVGAAVFAARPDTPLGSVGSLLTLGGVWNAQAVPPGRSEPIVAVAALLVTIAAAWGLIRLAGGRWDPQTRAGLVAAGLLGFLLAVWGVVPGARDGLTWLTAQLQPADLLRDGQRSLAPFVLLAATGWGAAVGELARRRQRAWLLVVVPGLLLPAAGWAVDGELAAVSWPADWPKAAAVADDLPPGPVLLLPWSAERIYPWNGNRPLTDPANRWLAHRTVGDQRLFVGARHTPQEDPLARRIQPAVAGTGSLLPALRSQGYAGVLVGRDQPGAAAVVARLAGAPRRYVGPGLVVYAVPELHPRAIAHAPLPPVLAADVLSGFVMICALASCVAAKTPRQTGGTVPSRRSLSRP